MNSYSHIDRPSPFTQHSPASRPVYLVAPSDIEKGTIEASMLGWARNAGYAAEPGSLLLVPGADGELAAALFGFSGETEEAFAAGRLAKLLPAGDWHVESALAPEKIALGFGLGTYLFGRYRKDKQRQVRLALADDIRVDVERQVAGVFLARDLINMPTNDMGPEQLESALRALGKHYGASVTSIIGDELLAQDFPLIHAVGRASAQAPRLLDMRWGREGAPRIVLVGKGVCFDTGGLDIKSAANMAIMKKDMGGAANVMGLALMIMDAGLDVELRVLIPAVENSIAGNAFRPGDIYRSRKGLTVQIDNTDAEGRLVLADALAFADETPCDLLVDMATLTGAARVALGPDVAPFFTDDDSLAARLSAISSQENDPMWRLPLWKGYDKDLKSRAADITNAPSGGMAGSITAALFLKRFVRPQTRWAHFDIYGWTLSEKPHAPVGGEAFAIRTLYRYVLELARQ
ncbi:leucyl aminopeptidase family protein [Pseudorhizobium flavum]|uniref:Leucyl aminopeptidase n=1 Tax=Pseudorhizobium flavum TaxID=1335061 RepID=A0A7X0DEV4_9HYPH|nr:leucyl aminopeptidase family protein [Pseudorhizobium flavum]MBB6180529.1 leucyl aminopeptidase [Pseudorhizobium flavum]CAD6595833.1 leucyl aminopeptidase family protein [Pseudorhizobium flavum]